MAAIISTSPWISNVFKLRLPGDNCLFYNIKCLLVSSHANLRALEPIQRKENKSICCTFYQHLAEMHLHLLLRHYCWSKYPSQDQWPHFIGTTSFPVKVGVSTSECISVCIPVCWQFKQWINYYCAVLTSVFHIEHDCGVILIQMFNCFGKQYLPAASSYVLMYLYTPE